MTALLKLTAACTYKHYVTIRGYWRRSWVRPMPENALGGAICIVDRVCKEDEAKFSIYVYFDGVSEYFVRMKRCIPATQYSKAIDEVISISRRAGTFFVKTSMILCLSTFTGNMSQLLSKVSSDHTWQLTNVEVTHWFLL